VKIPKKPPMAIHLICPYTKQMVETKINHARLIGGVADIKDCGEIISDIEPGRSQKNEEGNHRYVPCFNAVYDIVACVCG
jgi:hypothetical protein